MSDHPERSKVCPATGCSAAFTRKFNLDRHLKRNHPELLSRQDRLTAWIGSSAGSVSDLSDVQATAPFAAVRAARLGHPTTMSLPTIPTMTLVHAASMTVAAGPTTPAASLIAELTSAPYHLPYDVASAVLVSGRIAACHVANLSLGVVNATAQTPSLSGLGTVGLIARWAREPDIGDAVGSLTPSESQEKIVEPEGPATGHPPQARPTANEPRPPPTPLQVTHLSEEEHSLERVAAKGGFGRAPDRVTRPRVAGAAGALAEIEPEEEVAVTRKSACAKDNPQSAPADGGLVGPPDRVTRPRVAGAAGALAELGSDEGSVRFSFSGSSVDTSRAASAAAELESAAITFAEDEVPPTTSIPPRNIQGMVAGESTARPNTQPAEGRSQQLDEVIALLKKRRCRRQKKRRRRHRQHHSTTGEDSNSASRSRERERRHSPERLPAKARLREPLPVERRPSATSPPVTAHRQPPLPVGTHEVHGNRRDGPWSLCVEADTRRLIIGDSNLRHLNRLPAGWGVHAYPGATCGDILGLLESMVEVPHSKLRRIYVQVGINHRDREWPPTECIRAVVEEGHRRGIDVALVGVSVPAGLSARQRRNLENFNNAACIEAAGRYVAPLNPADVHVTDADRCGIHYDLGTVQRIFRSVAEYDESWADLGPLTPAPQSFRAYQPGTGHPRSRSPSPPRRRGYQRRYR